MRSHPARAVTGAILLTALLWSSAARPEQNASPPEANDKPAAASTRVFNTLHANVEQARVYTEAKLEYHVLAGEVQKLQIAVPLGHRILDVFTPDTAAEAWTSVKETNRQLVTVPLKSAEKKAIVVEVRTDSAVEGHEATIAGIDESGAVHGIHAVDAQSERGLIVVSHADATSVSVQNQAELVRVDGSSVAPASRRPGADYFRYFNTKFSLKVVVRPVEPRMTVEQFTQLGFIGYDLRLHSEMKYRVDRPGVSKFTIKIPENLEIDSVGADAIEDFRIDSEKAVLTVTLKQVQQGAVGVSIFARRLLKGDDFRDVQALPLLQPIGVVREAGEVTLFAAEGIVVMPDEDERVGIVPTAITGQPPLAGMRPIAAWKYSRRPIELPARVIRKPARVTATVGTSLKVHAGRLEVAANLAYELADVASSAFRVALPESAGESVSIRLHPKSQAGEIVETRRGDQPADGWVTWTVVTSQPVTGRLPLEITYAQSLPSGAAAKTKAGVGLPQAAGCEIEDAKGKSVIAMPHGVTGELGIEADAGVSLTAVPSTDDSQAIASADLALVENRGQLAYRYLSQPFTLMISALPGPANAVGTQIPRAAVEIGMGNGDRVVWRCRYRVVTKERQRLAIDLPPGAASIAAYVNGDPTAIAKVEEYAGEQGWERFHANVVRSGDADKPFALTLAFTSPPPSRAFESRGGRLDIPTPRIGNGNEASAIRQLRANIWIPNDFVLVDTPKHFVIESQATAAGFFNRPATPATDLDEWVGGTAPVGAELPTAGRVYCYRSLGGSYPLEFTWWDMPFYTRVLSGALIVVALVLYATSWRNRLAVVVLGASAFLLFALNNPDMARNAIVAARYGLVGLVAVWAIPPLYGNRRRSARREYASAPSATPERVAAVAPPRK